MTTRHLAYPRHPTRSLGEGRRRERFFLIQTEQEIRFVLGLKQLEHETTSENLEAKN